jgi:hypothetical protein
MNLNMVKPVPTTTSEQWPPVYNKQPDPQFSKIDSNLFEQLVNNDHLLNNGHFFSPKGGRYTQVWLYTMLKSLKPLY